MQNTKKETIEFNQSFITEWNQFCIIKGYSKRQASHASNRHFMQISPSQREFAISVTSTTVNEVRDRLGSRKGRLASKETYVKETIEYNAEFLIEWSDFCNAKGFVKRHAACAARHSFMHLSAEERESLMESVMLLGRERAVAKQAI